MALVLRLITASETIAVGGHMTAWMSRPLAYLEPIGRPDKVVPLEYRLRLTIKNRDVSMMQ